MALRWHDADQLLRSDPDEPDARARLEDDDQLLCDCPCCEGRRCEGVEAEHGAPGPLDAG